MAIALRLSKIAILLRQSAVEQIGINRATRMLLARSRWMCLGIASLLATSVLADSTARGLVFHDENGNSARDRGEAPLAGIPVSNGSDIVLTDASGKWELPAREDTVLFVIPQQGWRPSLGKHHLPDFHYVHEPEGSPASEYEAQAPTGALPASIEFPLRQSTVGETFSIFVFGDPQPSNQQHVDFLARDVIAEVAGVDGPVFGLSLGDIVNNDLSLYEDLNGAIGLIGLPWYNVPGNHDINFDAASDRHSDETFESVFGPPSYAFQQGKVHFLILDDVIYSGAEQAGDLEPERPKGQKPYIGGFRDDQFAFIENYLQLVPRDHLVVLAMHIPLFQRATSYYDGIESFRDEDRKKLFELLKNHPHTLSLSAHTHFQKQYFFKEEEGWPQDQPHHHFNAGTTCGDWFQGLPTYDGYPDATMRDGTPNGYATIAFDGNQYRIRYKVAGADESKQMSLHLPPVVEREALSATYLFANFYMGTEFSKGYFRIDGTGNWREMKRSYEADPRTIEMYAFQLQAFSKLPEDLGYRLMSKPHPSDHLWKSPLPGGLEPGFHLADVKMVDRFGREYLDRITFRVQEAAANP